MMRGRPHWIEHKSHICGERSRYELSDAPQFAICYSAPQDGYIITSTTHAPIGPYDKLEDAQDALVLLTEHWVVRLAPSDDWMAICDGVAVGPVATFEEACRLRLVSEKMAASTQARDADS